MILCVGIVSIEVIKIYLCLNSHFVRYGEKKAKEKVLILYLLRSMRFICTWASLFPLRSPFALGKIVQKGEKKKISYVVLYLVMLPYNFSVQ